MCFSKENAIFAWTNRIIAYREIQVKEYITIHHIGPLSHIDQLEIRPLTVLIGESAIGKSTLMKVLVLMRYLYKRANIRSFLKHSKITNSPFRIRFESLVKTTNLVSLFQGDSYIRYDVHADSGNVYSIEYGNSKSRRLVLPEIKEEDLTFWKESFVSENRNVIPSWSANALTNKNASLGFYFHETLNDFAQAVKDDKEYDLSYLNLRLSVKHPKGRPVKLTVMPKDDSYGAIELTEASSGIQTSTPLAVIVQHFAKDYSFKEAFRRSVLDYLYDNELLTKFSPVIELADLPKFVHIHLEEPELSLFPDAQCRLIDELVKATHSAHHDDRKMGIILATHSPYILNYLNVLLRQTAKGRARVEAEEMAVYRIYDGSAQSLMATDGNGEVVVDTYDLTEMMSAIYQEFNELSR